MSFSLVLSFEIDKNVKMQGVYKYLLVLLSQNIFWGHPRISLGLFLYIYLILQYLLDTEVSASDWCDKMNGTQQYIMLYEAIYHYKGLYMAI